MRTPARRERRRPGHPAGEAGFTLIEVLVAMVLLAVVAAAALQLLGAGLRLARAAGDQTEATLLADAKLADLPGPALDEGTTEGTDGIYHWTRRIALEQQLLPAAGTPDGTSPGPGSPTPGRNPAGNPAADPSGAPAEVRLARVSVEVRWGAGRRVELVTLRSWSPSP